MTQEPDNTIHHEVYPVWWFASGLPKLKPMTEFMKDVKEPEGTVHSDAAGILVAEIKRKDAEIAQLKRQLEECKEDRVNYTKVVFS